MVVNRYIFNCILHINVNYSAWSVIAFFFKHEHCTNNCSLYYIFFYRSFLSLDNAVKQCGFNFASDTHDSKDSYSFSFPIIRQLRIAALTRVSALSIYSSMIKVPIVSSLPERLSVFAPWSILRNVSAYAVHVVTNDPCFTELAERTVFPRGRSLSFLAKTRVFSRDRIPPSFPSLDFPPSSERVGLWNGGGIYPCGNKKCMRDCEAEPLPINRARYSSLAIAGDSAARIHSIKICLRRCIKHASCFGKII